MFMGMRHLTASNSSGHVKLKMYLFQVEVGQIQIKAECMYLP